MQTPTTVPKVEAERGAGGAEGPPRDGWTTVTSKAKRATQAAQQVKDQGVRRMTKGTPETTTWDISPVRYKQASRQHGSAGSAGKAPIGADQGDGKAVFRQLCQYLNSGAAQVYVAHTAVRLNDLAKNRRFKAYVKMIPISERADRSEEELRTTWSDEAPESRQAKYDGLSSVWNLHKAKHQGRLCTLLSQWMIKDKVGQRELEDRLQFFKLEPEAGVNVPEPVVQETHKLSYREAVATEREAGGETKLNAEQARLRELCLQPAEPTLQLRERTEDEVKAIVMILNHEIEVPKVPQFLKQSMAPSELACFADIFMALDTDGANLRGGRSCSSAKDGHRGIQAVIIPNFARHGHTSSNSDLQRSPIRSSMDWMADAFSRQATYAGRLREHQRARSNHEGASNARLLLFRSRSTQRSGYLARHVLDSFKEARTQSSGDGASDDREDGSEGAAIGCPGACGVVSTSTQTEGLHRGGLGGDSHPSRQHACQLAVQEVPVAGAPSKISQGAGYRAGSSADKTYFGFGRETTTNLVQSSRDYGA
ncbi:unnamed protein product [Phytophthora fragariaefolia]|uniref:Unnamed protein product n=1 Tax=Phytophthora fragariaefolia TaxID=1490495 RepID=A0A9W6UAB8_9STRA|nr:unnamed protein product [Phytophthora fragariaefolia]